VKSHNSDEKRESLAFHPQKKKNLVNYNQKNLERKTSSGTGGFWPRFTGALTAEGKKKTTPPEEGRFCKHASGCQRDRRRVQASGAKGKKREKPHWVWTLTHYWDRKRGKNAMHVSKRGKRRIPEGPGPEQHFRQRLIRRHQWREGDRSEGKRRGFMNIRGE